MTFKSGDRCRITVPIGDTDCRTYDAIVHLVDGEGRPLALMFDGMLEGFAGWVPLIWRDGQALTFRGTPVELE